MDLVTDVIIYARAATVASGEGGGVHSEVKASFDSLLGLLETKFGLSLGDVWLQPDKNSADQTLLIQTLIASRGADKDPDVLNAAWALLLKIYPTDFVSGSKTQYSDLAARRNESHSEPEPLGQLYCSTAAYTFDVHPSNFLGNSQSRPDEKSYFLGILHALNRLFHDDVKWDAKGAIWGAAIGGIVGAAWCGISTWVDLDQVSISMLDRNPLAEFFARMVFASAITGLSIGAGAGGMLGMVMSTLIRKEVHPPTINEFGGDANADNDRSTNKSRVDTTSAADASSDRLRVTAGSAGAAVGAAIGAVAGPIGMTAGAAIGGIAAKGLGGPKGEPNERAKSAEPLPTSDPLGEFDEVDHIRKQASDSSSDTIVPSRAIVVTGHSENGAQVMRFAPESLYVLRFSVAATSAFNLASGDIDVTGVPQGGLAARWVVASSNVEFLSVTPNGIVEKQNETWLAEFDLTIPGSGDSGVVALTVRTRSSGGVLKLVLLVAGEQYRSLTVTLECGAKVEHDVVATMPAHLSLRNRHEWTRPPEHLHVTVLSQAAFISTIIGSREYGSDTWTANRAILNNPIVNVRRALENVRVGAEAHLNNLPLVDMERRLLLGSWKLFGSWDTSPNQADSAHTMAIAQLEESAALRALANEGHRLFDACFPSSSKLRKIIEQLEPASRLDFIWTSRSSSEWISHVPWALMYLKPVKSSEKVDCGNFFGLRFRLCSKSWEPDSSSRALGPLDKVNMVHFLYWGDDPKDEVARESQWQRAVFGAWQQQTFVPDLGHPDLKRQVIEALESPQPDPAAILYFYCHCNALDSSDPQLQFSDTAQQADIVKASEMFLGRIASGPLVFANACTTASSDAHGTSELEDRFFHRGVRGFIGTESKVPVIMASRFAWLYFQFFLRKVDPEPMAAGEALAQARQFLWTQYRNPGGLFYCLANQYDLYLASHDEVVRLQRR